MCAALSTSSRAQTSKQPMLIEHPDRKHSTQRLSTLARLALPPIKHPSAADKLVLFEAHSLLLSLAYFHRGGVLLR